MKIFNGVFFFYLFEYARLLKAFVVANNLAYFIIESLIGIILIKVRIKLA